MADVPDLDPRWPALLAAARVWKASLIPRTSTGVAGPTNNLIEAIAAFDQACVHPRALRAYMTDGREQCGGCGEWITGGTQMPREAG